MKSLLICLTFIVCHTISYSQSTVFKAYRMFSAPLNSSGEVSGDTKWVNVNYKVVINPSQGIQRVIINKENSSESYSIISMNKDIDQNGNTCFTFGCTEAVTFNGRYKIILNLQDISKTGHLILMNYKNKTTLDVYELTADN